MQLNCHAHCKPNEQIINEGNIIKSKSNNIINAGEIINIRNNNENKVLINSIKEWLIFTLLQYNNEDFIKIKNKLIIINKNNKDKLIKVKYSIILNIMFDPIIE